MANTRRRHTQNNVQDALELFRRRAKELHDTRLVRDGYRPTFRVHSDSAEDRTTAESNAPAEEELRSFLMVMRHFLAQESPIHLDKVYNMLRVGIADDKVRTALAESREGWKRAQQGGGVRHFLDDQEERAGEMARRWLNEVYFHSDLDTIKDFERPTFWNVARSYQFLDFLMAAKTEVFNLERIIEYATEHGLLSAST